MRIKTKLRINTLLCVSLGIFVALTLFYALHRINQASEKVRVADTIVKSVAELESLTYYYIFHPEERPKQQWELKHASLGGLLREEQFQDEWDRKVVQRIRSNHESLKQIFTQLVSHLEAEVNLTAAEKALSAEARERIVAQFIAKSQMMSDDAFHLSRADKEAIGKVLWKSFFIVLISLILLIAAVSGVSGFLERTITGSLRRLREGTEKIAAGTGLWDLEHRIGMSAKDELGEFARSFDRMTERLQAVTVSKEELQKEIEERKRAEQVLEKRTLELQELTRTLDQRVKERTAELEKSNDMLQAEMAERLRLVAAVEQAGEGIVITSPEGAIYYANPAFESTSGCSQVEIPGKEYSEFFPEEDLKENDPRPSGTGERPGTGT